MKLDTQFKIPHTVPNEIINRWQKVIDLLLAELKTSVAIITRLEEGGFRIFHTHDSDFTQFDASLAEAFGKRTALALEQLDTGNKKLERFNQTLVSS